MQMSEASAATVMEEPVVDEGRRTILAGGWVHRRAWVYVLVFALLAAGALATVHVVRDHGSLSLSTPSNPVADARPAAGLPAAGRGMPLTNAAVNLQGAPLAVKGAAVTSAVPVQAALSVTGAPSATAASKLPETLSCPALVEAKGMVVRNNVRLEVGGGDEFPNFAYRMQYVLNQCVTTWPTNGTEVQRTVWTRSVSEYLTETFGRSTHALCGEVMDVRGTRDSGVYDVTYRVSHVRSVVPVTLQWAGRVSLRINTETAAGISKGQRVELRFRPRAQLGSAFARGPSIGLLRLLAPMSAASTTTAFLIVEGDIPVCAINGRRMPLAGI
jgi:hypothetical protein